jgi:glucose/arabinose dehydrogenase
MRITLGFLVPGGSAAPPAKSQEKAGAVPFTVPPGFVAERVAGPPLVEHPLMAVFDERGRLWVAESAGLNLKMAERLSKLPDGIRVLEDADGDGRFDRAHAFADKMTFPMGVLYHDGAVYSTAAPSLWRIEDKGGVAGWRQELVRTLPPEEVARRTRRSRTAVYVRRYVLGVGPSRRQRANRVRPLAWHARTPVTPAGPSGN